MEIFSLVVELIGIIGAIMATFAWYQAREHRREAHKDKVRQNQEIRVKLQQNSGASRIELPLEILRKEFTRAELLGRIGMIPTIDGNRFQIAYLNTKDFLISINQVRESDNEETLVILCSDDEMAQFKL